MEISVIVLTIVFNMALSLGVGSSTLAVLNFLVAIADGTINSEERKMMGLVYIVLRVAMLLLLITSFSLVSLDVQQNGLSSYSPLIISTWILLFVLYFNAILMTLHVMPSAFGPAIQAGTWYTFAIVTTVSSLGIVFSVTQFVALYVSLVVLFTLVVNIIIRYLDFKRTFNRVSRKEVV